MATILGIGECLLEVSPEADLLDPPVSACRVSGDIFNFLAVAAQLGQNTQLVSRIADDQYGKLILSALDAAGIDRQFVQIAPTGINGFYQKNEGEGQPFRFHYHRTGSAASQLSPEHLSQEWFSEIDLLYITGIGQAISKTSRNALHKACMHAKAHSKLVAYDPNYRSNLWQAGEAMAVLENTLPLVDLFLPSMEDLQGLLGITDLSEILSYLRTLSVEWIVLKQGPDGAIALNQAGTVCQAAPIRHTSETIGAGDIFNALLCANYLNGQPLPDAMAQACARTADYLDSYTTNVMYTASKAIAVSPISRAEGF